MTHLKKRVIRRAGFFCVLLGFIFVFTGMAPWYPELVWHLKRIVARSNPVVFHLPQNADAAFIIRQPTDALKAVARAQEIAKPMATGQPSARRIQIPTIQIDMPIIADELDSRVALSRGAWLIPNTAYPFDGGNTVISAHRFLYKTGSHTFYHLDKLNKGDSIVMEWDGIVKRYEVVETKVVKPTETSILDQDNDERLTLFTCDPVFSTKNRLVVIAKPVGL